MKMTLMQNQAFRRDVARALASNRFEWDDNSRIYVPGAKAYVGGVFIHDVNGRDTRMDPNLLPTESLVDILKVYFQGGTQRTGFYIAPFSGSADPASSTTAANFASTLTEFTNYSESARQVWTPPSSAISAASIDNSASVATFSINAASQTVTGFGLLTASAKSATTGVCVAATKLTSARTGLGSTDELNTKYTFTAADAG
jgi:hypothetical protein